MLLLVFRPNLLCLDGVSFSPVGKRHSQILCFSVCHYRQAAVVVNDSSALFHSLSRDLTLFTSLPWEGLSRMLPNPFAHQLITSPLARVIVRRSDFDELSF